MTLSEPFNHRQIGLTMNMTADFQAALSAKSTRLPYDDGDYVQVIDADSAELARSFYMAEGHYCTPIDQDGGFDVYDLGRLPSNDYPLTVEPVSAWAAYSRSHNPIPGFTAAYPAIDGDELAIDHGGSLARCSVLGETTLWEKVSA